MDSSLPLRVAGIDAGSNAIRLLAAEVTAPGRYQVLAADRAAVRLGRDVFATGALSDETVAAAAGAIAGLRARADALGVRAIRAVATSAMRESRNAAALVDAVRREAGLELEVIDAAEEARLAWVAIAARVPLGRAPWLTVDVGGGSVEVSLVSAAGILWSASYPFGAVRLLREGGGALDAALDAFAAAVRIPREHGRPVGMVATGGNAEVLARLAGTPPPATLPLRALRSTLALLSTLSVQQRIDRLGLGPDRADVIYPGGRIYERVAMLAGCGEMAVPGVGLRDGLVLDLAAKLAGRA